MDIQREATNNSIRFYWDYVLESKQSKSSTLYKKNLPRTFGFEPCEEKTAEEKRNEAKTETNKIATNKE